MINQNLNTAIENALQSNQLKYFYQPKVNLLQGKVSGVEALIRWIQPSGEILMPNSFIPAAELSGIICDISLAMLDNLINDFDQIESVYPDLIVSFNLTAKDFASDRFVNKWALAVSSGKIKPHKYQIEITESMLINKSEVVQKNIEILLATGTTLAMDDLGTGHSTLDVLSQWPFSVVKIDQGLIRRMHRDSKNAIIVRNIIYMAHQLGLKIIAEGVETEEAYNFLIMTGCAEVQGSLIGMPMPLDQLMIFLGEHHRWAASPVGLIHMAISDHLQWRRQLMDYTVSKLYNIQSMTISGSISIELNPHHCLLGQWYYGLGRSYRGKACYDALENPHNILHGLGAEILNSIEKGSSESEIILLLQELTNVSGQIINLLQQLELEAILE